MEGLFIRVNQSITLTDVVIMPTWWEEKPSLWHRMEQEGLIIITMSEYLTTCLCFPLMIASVVITREIVEVSQCNYSH